MKQNFISKDRAHVLLEKWNRVLNYESETTPAIKNDNVRLNTAMLLENQESWLTDNGYGSMINEANTAGSGGMFGSGGTFGHGGQRSSDFYASGDARLPKIVIPMVRRTFPELISHEIVGVQPMSGPVGLAFAIRYFYEDQPLGHFDGKDHADTNPVGYPVTPGSSGLTSLNDQEVGWNYLDTRHTGTTADWLTGSSADELSATGFDSSNWLGEDSGIAQLVESFEMSARIPQLSVRFDKVAVEAGTRRLATRWSIEAEQDLKNMNGIDIDNELTNTMSYELQAEIDREMIMRMIQICINAGHNRGFSVWDAATADARWLGERNRDLYAKIVVESNRIAVRNRRGSANFIIATPRVCAILEMLNEFEFMKTNSTVNTHPTGIAKVGMVGGRYNVYRDTRTEAQYQYGQRTGEPIEYCLLGYKGSEYYDTGIIYCPYIPVMIQRTIGPNDFNPRTGLLTRYGVVDNIFGADLYYHLIVVKGLTTVFTPGAGSSYL